jgi:hypothetical protein
VYGRKIACSDYRWGSYEEFIMSTGTALGTKLKATMKSVAIVAGMILTISCRSSVTPDAKSDLKIVGGSTTKGDPAVVGIFF